METEALQIVARTRSGWEAVDLGVAMLRAHWREVFGAWALLVLPVGVTVIVALLGNPLGTLLVLWWLRPVFGRVALHVLGRALFGSAPRPLETVRAAPGFLFRDLLGTLGIRRLSAVRAYTQPVFQLEGLRGAAARERARLLARMDFGPAAALHTVAAAANGALVVGAGSFVVWLAPDPLGDDLARTFAEWNRPDGGGGTVLAALYLLGLSVVEPLIAAGGFGLYVNRRVWLEGWDVEIAFRGLARRLTQAAAALLLVAGLALSPPPARAEPACIPEEPSSAAECAESVLSEDEFGHWEEVEVWVPRDWGGDDEAPEVVSFEWAASFGEWLAAAGEVLLWIFLVVATVMILARLARLRPRADAAAPPRPIEVFGLPLDPEGLPEDVVAEARTRFARGDAIGALSLLYRAALVLLIEARGLVIPDSATEGDCLHAVRATGDPPLVEDFRALNDAWVRVRYARGSLAPTRFEELCARWSDRLTGTAA